MRTFLAGLLAIGTLVVTAADAFAAGARKVPMDFNGDGKSDLLWYSNDFRAGIWLMDGATAIAYGEISWNAGSAVGYPDLNGDGRADIVWQHYDGAYNLPTSTTVLLMDGLTVLEKKTVNVASGVIRGFGDFNGDGKDDILWDGNGSSWVSLMDGATATTTTRIGTGGQYFRVIGDINGDGKADLIGEDGDSGMSRVWLMDGASPFAAFTLAPSSIWSPWASGDFDGDGRGDLLMFSTNPSLSDIYVAWLMHGSTAKAATAFPAAMLMRRIADIDGDGKDDILWFREHADIAISLLDGLATKDYVQHAWNPDHIVAIGDFNGDGHLDFVRRREGNAATLHLMQAGRQASESVLYVPSTAAGARTWQVMTCGMVAC